MKNRILIFSFLAFWFISFNPLSGAFSKYIQSIIDNYEKGEFDKCRSLLNSVQPGNSEEVAVVQYYATMLSDDIEIIKAKLQSLTDSYKNTKFAQKGLIDLGSIFLLDRDYESALTTFNKITDPQMPEKHYWMAITFYQKGDYRNSINSANQYIRLAKSGLLLEECYFLLTDSYINAKEFNNAVSTLKKLLSQPHLISDMQYLRYRYGYASEMLGNRTEAISQYKQGYEINRFSQLAYQIEDRLFEMRNKYGSIIDLSFLYPHSESPLPEIVVSEQMKAQKLVEQGIEDTTAIAKNLLPQHMEDGIQHGLFLQAGRFSNKNNAVRMAERIVEMGLSSQYIESKRQTELSWVVLVGPYQTQLDVSGAKQILKDNGIESFVVQR